MKIHVAITIKHPTSVPKPRMTTITAKKCQNERNTVKVFSTSTITTIQDKFDKNQKINDTIEFLVSIDS